MAISSYDYLPDFDACPESCAQIPPDFPVSILGAPEIKPIVISRFGDQVWDFGPYIKVANGGDGGGRIFWDRRGLHGSLIDACKAATFAYWRFGAYKSRKRPEPSTVSGFGRMMLTFAEWLQQRGVFRFSDITESMTRDYSSFIVSASRGLKRSTQECVLAAIEILFSLRNRLFDPLTCHPWPGQTSVTISGRFKSTREASTSIMPRDVAQCLFKKAAGLIESADEYFLLRERLIQIEKENSTLSRQEVQRLQRRWLVENSKKPTPRINEIIDLIDLTTACFFIVGLLSGMRSHEISSIKINSFYENEEDGESFFWLKGESHKTFEGQCEWMVPELVGRAIAVQESISEPFRRQLKQEIISMELLLSDEGLHAASRNELTKKLAAMRKNQDRIFVGRNTVSSISCFTGGCWRSRLKRFSSELSWNLHPHQLRRTFAVFVAQNAMGDLRYLRHHFKHWSMDMTLLYARNEKQDKEIYEDMINQVKSVKGSKIEHWLDQDVSLSGGHASRFKEVRTHEDVATLKDRRALANALSERMMVRSTGHSWCLSDGWGSCGGRGLYEMTRCGSCSESIIDDAHTAIWTGLYRQQRELLELEDIGPGGRARVIRDVRRIEKVLDDLGVKYESGIEGVV